MRFFLQLCLFFMEMLCISNTEALGLGKIRIDSFLGQPLEARVAFENMSDTEVSQLEVRIAGRGEYREMGLQYPDGIKFTIRLVAEQSARPYIHISTQRRIDELFVNLLLEVSSPSGKLTKAYTILPDPSPETLLSSGGVKTVVEAKTDHPAEMSEPDVPVDQNRADDSDSSPGGEPKISKPVQSNTPKSNTRHKSHHRYAVATKSSSVNQAALHHAGNSPVPPAMSLSISKHDPSVPVTSQESNDVLQEKLIVTQQRIEELNGQIAAMQSMIRTMQGKLDMTLQASAGVNSGVLESGSPSVSPAVNKPGIAPSRVGAVPVVKLPAANQQDANLPEINWLKPVLVFIALVLGVYGFIRYYKIRLARERQYDSHDEADNLPPIFDVTAAGQTQTELVAMPIDEKSLSFTHVAEQNGVSAIPPEYLLLMKAKALLRSNDVKQAEMVLLQAINTNPNNPNCYLALLGIYEIRGDVQRFEKLAKQLKEIHSEQAFNEAAAMGRGMDSDNPLYR